MQTFLPYPSILDSVTCLDSKRLGKQRVECVQILNALEGKTKGWAHHPAVLMWRGYEDVLRYYANECIIEWQERNFNNNIPLYNVNPPVDYPPWWDGKIHESHRQALLFKTLNTKYEDWYVEKLQPSCSEIEYILALQQNFKNFPHYHWPVRY